MAVFICQSCGNEHSSWEGKCPNCGHTEIIQLNQLTDRMIDRVVKGKYKIVRKLGQGGMGAVYLAEQVGIGHRVALKFLKNEFSNDVEIARRFMNEAKSYARVAHPNAVVFHDFGQDEDGNLFIAMEYCEGVDLKKVIAESKRLSVGDAIDVVLQVADVLANAHTKGVIHRDLKPENIMLRKGMRGIHAKVLDFGIARLMNEGTRLTVQGAIAGTPRYMAPEQVEGKEVDARSDLYALGIVTFEALTGVQPFDGGTIAEILRKQVLEPMPHLKDIAPELDFPEIDRVIQKAVAKNPADRYPDMMAFAAALSQATPTLTGRSGVGLAAVVPSVATPRPQAPTDLDVEGTQNTLLRGANDSPARGLATPAPVGSATTSASVVLPPPKSKLPMVATGFVLATVVGAAAWALWPQKVPPTSVPPPPLTQQVKPLDVKPLDVKQMPVDPNPAPDEVKPGSEPANPTSANPTGATGTSERDDDRGKDYFGRGENAWKHGNLESARIDFETVPQGTRFYADAREYLRKIDRIEKNRVAGVKLCSEGNFNGGINLLSEAARLNGAVTTVQSALRQCSAAKPPDTIE